MHCDSYSALVAPQRQTRHNGFAVRDFRLIAGLTIDQLAQQIDMSAPHLRNVENELREVRPDKLAAIAAAVGARQQALWRERFADTRRRTLHNGFAIRDFRVKAGMSIDEMAERVSISSPHLRNMENELREASPVYLHRIADVLQVRAGSLVRDRAALTGETTGPQADLPPFPPSGSHHLPRTHSDEKAPGAPATGGAPRTSSRRNGRPTSAASDARQPAGAGR